MPHSNRTVKTLLNTSAERDRKIFFRLFRARTFARSGRAALSRNAKMEHLRRARLYSRKSHWSCGSLCVWKRCKYSLRDIEYDIEHRRDWKNKKMLFLIVLKLFDSLISIFNPRYSKEFSDRSRIIFIVNVLSSCTLHLRNIITDNIRVRMHVEFHSNSTFPFAKDAVILCIPEWEFSKTRQ